MGANKDLGLPYGDGMERVAVCFDVDGTLVGEGDLPIAPTIVLLRMLTAQQWKNVDVIVWSGGGRDYARTMAERHVGEDLSGVYYYSKLDYERIRSKYNKIIAIDDVQDTRLGDVNLIVRNK